MVVGLNVSWAIPIAYFLTHKISAEEKASIIKQAIMILSDIGVNVVSVTFDGTSTNFAAAEILRAKLRKPLQMQCYFYNPANEQKKKNILFLMRATL